MDRAPVNRLLLWESCPHARGCLAPAVCGVPSNRTQHLGRDGHFYPSFRSTRVVPSTAREGTCTYPMMDTSVRSSPGGRTLTPVVLVGRNGLAGPHPVDGAKEVPGVLPPRPVLRGAPPHHRQPQCPFHRKIAGEPPRWGFVPVRPESPPGPLPAHNNLRRSRAEAVFGGKVRSL